MINWKIIKYKSELRNFSYFDLGNTVDIPPHPQFLDMFKQNFYFPVFASCRDHMGMHGNSDMLSLYNIEIRYIIIELALVCLATAKARQRKQPHIRVWCLQCRDKAFFWPTISF